MPQFHLGSFYTTPEIAMLIGNFFSFLLSPKATQLLTLREKIQIAPDVYDFVFTPARRFAFVPGQYMEWTLGHSDPDGRGNRRYFTQSSSFKHAMLAMDGQTEIVAAQLAGDFVLPSDPAQPCVCIAGGIGITPFRSMLKYLLDTRQRRPITLFYANRRVDDIVYRDVLDQAYYDLGIKTILKAISLSHCLLEQGAQFRFRGLAHIRLTRAPPQQAQ